MDKQISDRLELFTRAGAVALVAIYGAGFLLVSFHNARYGFVEFGLFRTKLLSAGILFAVFFSIPFLEAAKAIGLFGFQGWKPHPSVLAGKLSAFLTWLLQLFVFFGVSAGLSFILQLFLSNPDFRWPAISIYLAFSTVFAAFFVLMGLGRLRSPAILIGFTISVVVLYLAATILAKLWTVLILVAWFTVVGSLARQMETPLRKSSVLVEVNPHAVLLHTVGVFSLFALFIYPKVSPVFGGGKSTHVLLQFTTVSPIENSTTADVCVVLPAKTGHLS